jgi:hypothetical protein
MVVAGVLFLSVVKAMSCHAQPLALMAALCALGVSQPHQVDVPTKGLSRSTTAIWLVPPV